MKNKPAIYSRILAAGLACAACLPALPASADPYEQDFDTWAFTGMSTPPFPQPLFPTSTNEDWVAVNAAIGGPTDDGDFPSVLSSPRACWLNTFSTTTNTYLQSPILDAGVGEISFRTKGKYADNQVFVVQALTNGGDWTTYATFTNTSASFWRTNSAKFVLYDPARVRIRKTSGSGLQRWLGIENVVISPAPPPIELANESVTPPAPAETQAVTIRVDADPEPGVAIESGFVYIRHEDGTAYGAVPMSLESGDTYAAVLPPSAVGTVYYYFEFYAEGFATPALYPEEAPGAGTFSFAVSGGLGSDREQDFDDWPFTGKSGSGPFAVPIFTNSVFQGWTANDASISGKSEIPGLPTPPSTNHACWLNALEAGGNPCLLFPGITSAVSRLYFATYNRSALPQEFNVETSTSGAEGTWEVAAELSQSPQQWITNVVPLDAVPPFFLRIRKTNDQNFPGRYLGIDNVVLSYPPADAVVGNMVFAPRYPAYDQEVTVTCTVTSAPTVFPAYGFAPTLYHRPPGGEWSTSLMTPAGGDLFSAAIPPYDPGLIEYYIRCDFSGYYYETTFTDENQSPAFLPEAPHTDELPDTFFSYPVRYFHSAYSNVVVTGNVPTVVMDMVGDNVWQGVLTESPTNLLTFTFAGLNKLDSSDGEPGTDTWADPRQEMFRPPIVDTFATNGNPISAQVETNLSYAIRFDLDSEEYWILPCKFQDFNFWALDDDRFAEGSQGTVGSFLSQDFDTWDPNPDAVQFNDFESPYWTSNTFYPDWYLTPQAGDISDPWLIHYGRVVNDADRRCELYPVGGFGWFYQSAAVGGFYLLDGEGVLEFDYRATDTTPYKVFATNGATWANYTISTSIRGNAGVTDDGCTHSVFYYAVGGGSYYECRATETNGTQVNLTLYKCYSSTETPIYSTTFTETLSGVNSWSITVTNTSPTSVRHTVNFGGTKRINNIADSSSPYLLNGGIGFGARDTDMRVESVDVSADSYSQDFDNPPATEWPTNAAWVQNGIDLVRSGRPTDPLGLDVSTSADYTYQSPDMVHASFTNITTLDYTEATVEIHRAVRAQTVISHETGTGSLRLDNVRLTSWHGKTNTYGFWQGTDSIVVTNDVYGDAGRSLELRASRAIDTEGFTQVLRSPQSDSVGSMSFQYRTPPDNAPARIVIQWSQFLAGPWSNCVARSLDSGGEWKSFATALEIENPGYIRIAHTTSVDEVDARLFLDRVRIYPYQGGGSNVWRAYNALISGNQEDKLFVQRYSDTQRSAYLNHATDEDIRSEIPYTNGPPFIKSPRMDRGIGDISFWARIWDNGNGPARLRVEEGPTEDGPWSVIATQQVANTVYQPYLFPHYSATNYFVRISNTLEGDTPGRLCLDNLLVVDPLGTDITLTNVYTLPAQPLFDAPCKVRADITEFFLDPEIMGVTCYVYATENNWAQWQEGQGGVFPRGMSLVNTDTSSIPTVYTYETDDYLLPESVYPLPIDFTIQYYVKGYFDGRLNAEKTSPRRFKEQFDNPTWYEPTDYNDTYGGGTNIVPYTILFSCPTGSVFFNEINLMDNWEANENAWTNEFVELCGPAEASIAGWKIEMYDDNGLVHATYTVPNGTDIPDDADGFGFWVLGDSGTRNVDMVLTNLYDDLDSQQHIPFWGGMKLYRSMGAIEQAVYYNTDTPFFAANGFEQIMSEDDWYTWWSTTGTLQLMGIGNLYGDFVGNWQFATNYNTAGAVNFGQTLTLNEPLTNLLFYITALWQTASETYVRCTGTNDVAPYPTYSTNLVPTPINWLTISPYSSTYPALSNGTYTLWFNTLTNRPVYFYRIKADL
jgi:hypothetical protein